MEAMGMNYLAVLVASLAYTALGALWYSPIIFGTAWMRLIGKTKDQVAKDFTPINYFYAVVTAFIASYGIARIMFWSGQHGAVAGLKMGFFCGVCFVLMALWVNDAFEKRPAALTIINALFHILGFMIAGVIIGVW